jgi:hypothetical protein
LQSCYPHAERRRSAVDCGEWFLRSVQAVVSWPLGWQLHLGVFMRDPLCACEAGHHETTAEHGSWHFTEFLLIWFEKSAQERVCACLFAVISNSFVEFCESFRFCVEESNFFMSRLVDWISHRCIYSIQSFLMPKLPDRFPLRLGQPPLEFYSFIFDPGPSIHFK